MSEYTEMRTLAELLIKYKDLIAFSGKEGVFSLDKTIFGQQDNTLIIIITNIKDIDYGRSPK